MMSITFTWYHVMHGRGVNLYADLAACSDLADCRISSELSETTWYFREKRGRAVQECKTLQNLSRFSVVMLFLKQEQ